MVGKFKLASLSAICSIALTSPVFAEGDVAPFLSITTLSDNNLFRIDSGEESTLADGVSKSDTFYRTAVGLNVDWKVSRQAFLVSASLLDTRYENNTQLDNLGKNLSARWNWLIGSRLKGVLSANESISLSSFEDTNVQEKVERTTQTLNGNANWRYHPDWQVGFAVRSYDSSYDSELRSFSDLTLLTTSLNLDYLVKTGSRVGLKLQNEQGEFPNRLESAFVDREYTQNAFLMTTVWVVSGKSNLNSELGFVSRKHPDITERDYNGFNATLRYNWSVTGKVNIFTEAFRRIASTEDLLANYSENTGAKLRAQWALTDKVTFSGNLTRETRDFSGQTNLVSGLSSTLEDRYTNKSIGLKYEPHRNFDIGLNYTQSARDSNALLRDYSADLWSLTLKINL